MMQENRKRKQELESAIKEYLCQAEMHPISEAIEMVMKNGDYAFVFGLSSFHEGDRQESGCFLVPIEAEIKLMERIDCLFDTLVGPATVRSSLQSTIHIIAKKTELIFPFESDEQVETDEQEQQYLDKVYELLNPYYESRCDALVPLYQLECAYGVEFPLANAFLFSGGSQSQLATLASNNDFSLRDTDRKQIEPCSYLKFPVTGDTSSRLEQIECKVEQALQVLRFIYPWFEKDGRLYNPSHGVSMWKHSNRTIVYDRTSATRAWSPWNSAKPNGIHGTQRIDAELLRYAQEVYGLGDINYHFQNSDCNSVSKRICRALSFCDTAAQATVSHVAFSNFIISVDILLPPKNVNATVLTGHLKSLIEHGKFYTGEMKLNDKLADPNSTTWPERVRLTTSDFEEFYRIRGQILHGNDEKHFPISQSQGKKARQIAHNAIRAYAYLARVFNWQNDKEAKIWFKKPCKPPEMKSP